MCRVPLALLGIAAMAALVPPGQARQADVSGAWDLVIQTRHGEMGSTVRFAQDGEKLKVSMTDPRGGDTTGEGSIRGNDIRWSVVRKTAHGTLTVVYTGTVQGNAMSGQADIEGGDSAPWKAVRR